MLHLVNIRLIELSDTPLPKVVFVSLNPISPMFSYNRGHTADRCVMCSKSVFTSRYVLVFSNLAFRKQFEASGIFHFSTIFLSFLALCFVSL